MAVSRVVADRGTKSVEEAGGGEREAALLEETGKEREEVEYDWEKEWYPMYLTEEMPKAAPLGLTVFDRSLVLFYDGNGELNCLEDRCPHRCTS